MKAILLAAGFGMRLRPLTLTTPKCLLPCGGKPLLGMWFDRLSAVSVTDFLVNTHYLAEQVLAFVSSLRGASVPKQSITCVHEPELLGTAGTLIKNRDFFEGGDGLLIHADNYCLADLRAFLDAHASRPKSCLMTMMTFRTRTPESCGIVEVDQYGVVQGFHEKVKNPPGNLANGAVYALSAGAIAAIPSSAVDFSTEVLPLFVGRIQTCETHEAFWDIGTPEAYARVV